MIAHLPLYLKLDNDYVGASRDTVGACLRFTTCLVDRMPEIRMGETQYSQVQISSSDNPSVWRNSWLDLELEYDAEEAEPTVEEEEVEVIARG